MPSPIILKGICFRLRMMSVASSTTPGMGLNSCATPSMRTARDGRAFNRAQQHAAQAGADGGAESALERLRGEHAVAVVERFRIGDQPLRFLESFEHIFLVAPYYFEYNSTISCSFNWIWTRSSRLGWSEHARLSDSRGPLPASWGWARGPWRRARAEWSGLFLLLLANFDHVVRLHLEGRNIHAAAVHIDVPVANQLAALRPRGPEAHPVNHVVQTPLQHVEHVARR